MPSLLTSKICSGTVGEPSGICLDSKYLLILFLVKSMTSYMLAIDNAQV